MREEGHVITPPVCCVLRAACCVLREHINNAALRKARSKGKILDLKISV